MKICSLHIGEFWLERIDAVIGTDKRTITSQITITTSLTSTNP